MPLVTKLSCPALGVNPLGQQQAFGSTHYLLTYRNTYSWGRRQFAALSSNYYLNEGLSQALAYQTSNPSYSQSEFASALSALGAADYNKADLKHWLMLGADQVSITEALSSERDPSPDAAGQVPGLRTWYNYASKPSPELLGNKPQVSCIARLLPDGTSQYTTYNYYSTTMIPGYPTGAGFVSDSESSYSRPNGTVGVLTNWFTYATNSVDLISVTNSAGQWWNLGYNGSHQITVITNALNQVTTLGWDPYNFSLTGIQWPGGQSASLGYGSDDYGRLQTVSWSPSGRSFTVNAYTNGLPNVVTDDRGLTVTNTWDGLNRLTSIKFPDGTSISNIYNKLDLVGTKDRLGNWARYSYDGLQHLTVITNANQAVTVLSWCNCSALESILDAQTNLTSLYYDNQGNLTNIAFPDTSSLTYQYDLAGRMTNAFDGAGRSVRLSYNNQGLATAITGAYGTLQSIVYDALNRPISITDANGVTVTNQYDAIGELLKRTWLADGISEGFGYNTNGLIAYTNRDQQVTRLVRDAAGRITAVTNANIEVVQAAYDSLNNIISLVDGLNHTNTWQYNEYGWLTNKVDGLNRNAFRYAYNANGWVTNRWTPQMGNTAYGYDNVGNLKSIVYPQLTINYSYDADNRLTNMVDAVGTTTFGYTPAGQLQSENGPWANDTVSYLYSQMLRTNLTLTQTSGSWMQGYSYDSAWRLQSLASPAGNFGYSHNFTPASALVSGITLPNSANIANSYDTLARLKETDLNNQWGHTLDGYTYGLDALGLRTNITRNLGLTTSIVTAGYDKIGQITSWLANESGGTPRLNEQLGFGYDAAHNLLQRTNNALVQTFTVDSANELTNVSRTGTLTESGTTPAPAASVTVNGQVAQTYGDLTFVAANNTLVNGDNTFTNIAVNPYGLKVTNVLTVNLPQSVALGFDNNGNLTNDGTRSFAYDSENQLTNVMVAGSWKSEFIYDGLGKRRIAKDFAWQGGTWGLTNEVHYIYDGYLVIQERDANNNPFVTYTRGLDLSGTRQRTGGIGGLLARTDANGSTFYHADGNGNITALMDGSQYMVARYLYGPFGKLTGQWGTLASANTMQFSSMPQHDGLVLYPARPYFPELARFGSSDPIGERGGINLYRLSYNNPANFVDPNGLWGIAIGNNSGSSYFNIGLGNPTYYFSPDVFTTPSTPSMPFDLGRSLYTGPLSPFSQNEWDDTSWYNHNRPNSIAAAEDYFRKQIGKKKPCDDKNKIPDFVVHAQKGGEIGHSEWELGDPEQSSLESIFWIGDYAFRLGDVNYHQNDDGSVNYTADILLVDKLGAEGKYVDAMPGYARDAVTGAFGSSREYISGRWQINGTIK